MLFNYDQGDPFWVVDLLINLTWKSSIILLLVFGVLNQLKRTSTLIQIWVWRVGFIGLMALFLCSPLSIWQFQPVTAESAPSLGAGQQIPQGFASEFVKDETLGMVRASGLSAEPYKPIPWSFWVGGIWLVGGLILLGRAIFEFLILNYFSRKGTLLKGEPWDHILSQAKVKARKVSSPTLLISSSVQVPLTYGWQHPKIILPVHALEWERDKLEQVFLHELIHIKRKDYLFHWLVIIVRALYWFNPFVWRAARLFRLGSEWACDEAMLQLGTDKFTYAEHLLAIASGQRGKVRKMAFPFAKESELQSRIKRLLQLGAEKRGFRQSHLILLFVGFFCLSMGTSIHLRLLSKKPYSDQAYQSAIEQLERPETSEKLEGLLQLGAWGKRTSFNSIKNMLNDDSLQVRKTAMWALQEIGCLPAFNTLSRQSLSKDTELAAHAQQLLNSYNGKKLRHYIIDIMNKASYENWLRQHLKDVTLAGKGPLLAHHLAQGKEALTMQIEVVLQNIEAEKSLSELKELLNQ